MDREPQFEQLSEHRYSVSAIQDDQDVAIVVEITPEVQAWLEARDYDEESAVKAAIRYLTERQRVDELPTKLFLEDIDAAYDGFRAAFTRLLDQSKADA